MLSKRPQVSLALSRPSAGDDGDAPAVRSESPNPDIDRPLGSLYFAESDGEDSTLDFLHTAKKQCGAPAMSKVASDMLHPLGTSDPASKTGLRPSLESVVAGRAPPATVGRMTPALSEAGDAQRTMKSAPKAQLAFGGPASYTPANRASHLLNKYSAPAPAPALEKNEAPGAPPAQRPEHHSPPRESAGSPIEPLLQGAPSSGAESEICASGASEPNESHAPTARPPPKKGSADARDTSQGSLAPAAAAIYREAAVPSIPLLKPRSNGLLAPMAAPLSGTALTGVDSRLREPRLLDARQPMRPEGAPRLSTASALGPASAPASTMIFPTPSPSPAFAGSSLQPRAMNPLLLAPRRAPPLKQPTLGAGAPTATIRSSASLLQGSTEGSVGRVSHDLTSPSPCITPAFGARPMLLSNKRSDITSGSAPASAAKAGLSMMAWEKAAPASPPERQPLNFTKHARDQVPTLNKMKQQLHQLSVSFAQLTNEALMAWDPELEYKLHLLQEQLLIVKRNEDALDRYDQDEDVGVASPAKGFPRGQPVSMNVSPMPTPSSSSSGYHRERRNDEPK